LVPVPQFPSFDFLGLRLHDTGREGLIRWLVEPDPTTVAPRVATYLNAHTVNLALKKGPMPLMLPYFDLLYPDGMAVVREARRRGFAVKERVSAADFFEQFCLTAAGLNRKLAFIGGERGVAEACSAYMSNHIPALEVELTHHGVLPTGSDTRRELLARLEEIRPDITLIGMGSPRQEALALELREGLKLPTVWCVGALFEYYAPGVRRRAPKWMCEHGLEWLFRLSQEPGRLAGRYLIGNIEYLLRVRGILKSPGAKDEK
jgi:N-acetylglucosaminyldiphosphoundecaprenol N-acetyl-beta-D-mannosaminyltransferase